MLGHPCASVMPSTPQSCHHLRVEPTYQVVCRTWSKNLATFGFRSSISQTFCQAAQGSSRSAYSFWTSPSLKNLLKKIEKSPQTFHLRFAFLSDWKFQSIEYLSTRPTIVEWILSFPVVILDLETERHVRHVRLGVSDVSASASNFATQKKTDFRWFFHIDLTHWDWAHAHWWSNSARRWRCGTQLAAEPPNVRNGQALRVKDIPSQLRSWGLDGKHQKKTI